MTYLEQGSHKKVHGLANQINTMRTTKRMRYSSYKWKSISPKKLTISNTKTLPCTEPHTSPRTRPQSTCKTTNQCADNLITIIAAQNSEMPKCIKIQAPTEPPRASCPTQQNQTHNKPTCYTHDSKQLLQKAFRQPPQARYQKKIETAQTWEASLIASHSKQRG
jgi:hypothetical protein